MKSGTTVNGILALLVGIAATVLIISAPIKGLGYTGRGAFALLAFAMIVWASETIPLPVSSLIVVLIQPILGIVSFSGALSGFGNPILFLLLGGFIIAEGVGSSGLGDRISYVIMSRLGGSPEILLFGVILLTGVLSAWMSNLVAFAIVLPVVKRILSATGQDVADPKSSFPKKLILGASYGSLAGGLATQIGTGPNLIATSFIRISFVNWMVFGIPLAFALMLLTWRILMAVFPTDQSKMEFEARKFGPLSGQERNVVLILLVVVALSITSSITSLDEYVVALIGAVFLFTSGSISWKNVQKTIDWGTLIFFGAALSLGNAMFSTGAASWALSIIQQASGSFSSHLLIVLVLMGVATALTQVLSNVGLAAILMPIVIGLAADINLPASTLVVPAAVACSLSFMFPMSDPTIAMAYGTGIVRGRDIFKAGLFLTIVSAIVSILVITVILEILMHGAM